MLWYSLEVPHRGTSNEYHNMFSGSSKQDINNLKLMRKMGKRHVYHMHKVQMSVRISTV